MNKNKKTKLICNVIDKVGELANSVEANETNAIKELLESYKILQEHCTKDNVVCQCGKKLRGIERA